WCFAVTAICCVMGMYVKGDMASTALNIITPFILTALGLILPIIKKRESRTLEHDMALAIVNKEFVVYYQPIVDSFSQEIYSYEALIRWLHPLKGLLSPDNFIPVAEKTGMINEMGKAVLEIACREAACWAVPAKISVNVSPVQLSSKAFVGIVLSILKETGLPADRLELEVTEPSLFTESTTPMNTLNKLRALGVKISIDDFGTGYSSLSRLSKLAFDKIKIDKSFVHSISTQEDALNIIKLITGMAKSLNMKAVAEGVETIGENAFLGCYNLETINFPSTIESVGTNVVKNTIWEKNEYEQYGAVIINNILSSVQNVQSEYKLPDGIKKIASGVFYGNTQLTKIDM
ncbi:MAG: EAL domain-containing protein, partial [Veillonella sp.]|nr:EAL domain-containing protein [Veillonella sp.]